MKRFLQILFGKKKHLSAGNETAFNIAKRKEETFCFMRCTEGRAAIYNMIDNL